MVEKYSEKNEAIGILMLNTEFPRLKGDIGNRDTFSFPTISYVVQEACSSNVVVEPNKELVRFFIEGAQALEQQGVKAITTSCGFLSIYQQEIARSVHVPVATSALLLLPVISQMIGGEKIGILTASETTLQKEYFVACGAENVSREIKGMEGTEFYKMYVQGNCDADINIMETEIYNRASEFSEAGAILLECTNMPPFSAKLYNLGIPVFDIRTLVCFLYYGIMS